MGKEYSYVVGGVVTVLALLLGLWIFSLPLIPDSYDEANTHAASSSSVAARLSPNSIPPEQQKTRTIPVESANEYEPTPESETYTSNLATWDRGDYSGFERSGFKVPGSIDPANRALQAICSNLGDGGDGLITFNNESEWSPSQALGMKQLYKALAVKYTCPSLVAELDFDSASYHVTVTSGAGLEPLYLQLHPEDTPVHGGGNTVACSDGWISHSGGKQGACSHHGGLR